MVGRSGALGHQRAEPGKGPAGLDSSTTRIASVEVVVEDKQLSLAIGKKGQNVRLAAKLTGWRIDIKSEEEKRREVEAQFEGVMPELRRTEGARERRRARRQRESPATTRRAFSMPASATRRSRN
jgi:hypothetical protein